MMTPSTMNSPCPPLPSTARRAVASVRSAKSAIRGSSGSVTISVPRRRMDDSLSEPPNAFVGRDVAPVASPTVLKLVLPKGSLERATMELFDAADLSVRRGSSVTYKADIDDPRVESVRILRPQEIPTYVADGLFDLGITGPGLGGGDGESNVVVAGRAALLQGDRQPDQGRGRGPQRLARTPACRTCPRGPGVQRVPRADPEASSTRRASRPTSACRTGRPRPRCPTSSTASSTSPRPATRSGPPACGSSTRSWCPTPRWSRTRRRTPTPRSATPWSR